MKKTLLSFFSLACAISMSAQSNLVANGDFENWNFSNGNPTSWDGRHPSVLVEESTDAQSGAKSAKMEIDDFSYGVGYVSSSGYKIAFKSGKTYECSFYYKVTSGDFSEVSLAINYTPSGEIFPTEAAKGEATEHSLNTWHKVQFTYTPTSDTSADNIRVYARTSDKMTILVDNVIITEASTSGIENNSDDFLSIYPNPATDYIVVNKENVDCVKIYSLSGALVTKTNKNTINVSHLPAGTYIVSVLQDGKTISSKVSKK